TTGTPLRRARLFDTRRRRLRAGRLVDRAALDNGVAVALVVRHAHLHGAGAGAALRVGAGEVDVIHAAVAGHTLVAGALGAHLRRRGTDAVTIDRRVAITHRVG